MPVTEVSNLRIARRRFVVGVLAAGVLRAQSEDVSHETLFEVLARFTSALSEGNSEGAIENLDTSVPAMGVLARQLRDLVAVGEISCLVDPLEWPDHKAVLLDWLLEIRAPELVGGLKRKREKLTCRFVKKGKKWKIASLEPVEFFKSDTN